MTSPGQKTIKSHKDLDVWQKAMAFVVNIYQLTSEFPQAEKYGLASQIQRAAVSVPSNIAEGAARKGSKEFVQFLYVALGSLAEVETQVEIAHKLGYAKNIDDLDNDLTNIRRMLLGLINYLKNRDDGVVTRTVYS